MSALLEPLLGFELARERANNIAQMLVFGPRDATYIACGMLKKAGLQNADDIAQAVVDAWQQGVRAVETSA